MKLALASEVVGVFDLKEISLEGSTGDTVRLRLEIIRVIGVCGNTLVVHVWRMETYHIRPTFPSSCRANADEIILVRDLFLEGLLAQCTGSDVQQLLQQSLEVLRGVFVVNGRN